MSGVVRSNKLSNFDFQHDMSVDFSNFTTVSILGDAPVTHLKTWVGHSLMGGELGINLRCSNEESYFDSFLDFKAKSQKTTKIIK